MAKILADFREKGSGVPKELERLNTPVKLCHLKSADYVLESETQSIGIERKTKLDFLNSIVDKRILTQLIALKENFSHPLLIIEGLENLYEIRNFNPNSIRGMLAAITLDYQIPVIQTRNYRDTAKFLQVILNRLEKSKRPYSLLKGPKPLTPEEQQLYIIESFPGIGPTLAQSILEKFETISNFTKASKEELLEIPKLGPKKAEQILNLINLKYSKKKSQDLHK